MGVLTLRNVDDALIRALKIRAAHNGRSAEAEHRLILEQALQPNRQEIVEGLRAHRKKLEGRDFSDVAEIIRRSRDVNFDE